MLSFFNSFILMKKIFFVAALAFACNTDDDLKKPALPEDKDDPKQYGAPFMGVPDPQDLVMYEVNIRAFSAEGNFQGVIDRLDNIKELGINAIWLMPIHPVGQLKSAGGLGSPYAVQNYLGVNTEFGDLTKLRELVQKAHDRNMSVIIDWVANHTSWDNPWITNKSWYTLDASGNIIIPPGTNWQDVAELNYSSNDMREAMIDAMKYWVLEANVDGFRCDAVDFVPTDFWKQALDELKSISNRKLILLAEGGKKENFDAGFQLNYAWDFYNNLKQVYQINKAASSIFTTHQTEYSTIPVGAVKLRYTTNHDESAWEETPVEIFGGTGGALSASVITIFTSAAPLLYGSQETGRAENLAFFTRDPIEWSANIQLAEKYEMLFSVYNETQVFKKGSLAYYNNNDVAVFKRVFEDDEYLIIVNVRNAQTNLNIDLSLQGRTWNNVVDNSSIFLTSQLTIAPFGYYILKK